MNLGNELEGLSQFRQIEAEQQQRLRALLASSDRERRWDHLGLATWRPRSTHLLRYLEEILPG